MVIILAGEQAPGVLRALRSPISEALLMASQRDVERLISRIGGEDLPLWRVATGIQDGSINIGGFEEFFRELGMMSGFGVDNDLRCALLGPTTDDDVEPDFERLRGLLTPRRIGVNTLISVG